MPPGPPPPPPQYPQQPYGSPPPPAPKKSGVLKWVLLGAGFLVFCLVAFFGVATYFVYRTVKNAGFDAELMQKNPGLAMARMATALNPDLERVSTNESAGTITVREKSTGKVMTMKFDTEKKTMVVIDEESGKEAQVRLSGDEKSGALDITTPEGSVRFGTSAGNIPSWAPVYPGSSPQGAFSTTTAEGAQNTFTFQTKDPAAQVLTWVENQLKGSGFGVTSTTKTPQGGLITAQDAAEKRMLMITVGSSGDGTEGSVTAIEKK